MMRIVINPNDLSKPERAEERIADLEKQLAEERRAAEQNHLAACQEKDRAEDLTRQLAEQTKRREAAVFAKSVEGGARLDLYWKERAEAAEKRIAELLHDAEQTHAALEHHAQRVTELQALVDAATIFRYGAFSAEYAGLSDCWSVYRKGAQLMGRRLPHDEAIVLARELAEKEKK